MEQKKLKYSNDTFLESIIKKLAFKYFRRLTAPKYPYLIEPIQISNIILSLEKLKNIKGSILEIGVARGMTSYLIAEHISTKTNPKEKFYCIDTFESFTEEDIEFEVKNRKKDKNKLNAFNYNDYHIWKKNFEQFTFLSAIKSDVKKFDFSQVAPIKFCFLDVDLYQPTLVALENMEKHLHPEAIIMLDDIVDDNRWDGAFQAANEFVEKRNLILKRFGNKGGSINYASKNT
jgi:predicted O-methyltransferase YrrM